MPEQLTPEQAQAAAATEADRLLRDAAEQGLRAPSNRDPASRAAAKQRLNDAFARAAPGMTKIGDDIGDSDSSAPAETPSPGAALSRDQAVAELQKEYGSRWEQRVEPARVFAKVALGDEAFAAVERIAGNDPEVVKELVSMSEGPYPQETRGWINQYLAKGVWLESADWELKRIDADEVHLRAAHDRQHPGYPMARGRERALLILKKAREDMPALVRALEAAAR
jgi:hypothetical protein